ncbi:hypothetical protein C6401_14010 [Arthrobacter woluwensis]|uniref:hypothetical protein n=1 Tax=Arthrobacter woluwensis TaxID=156980 RepID=UPI000D134EE9|nr:hypothetical protein [Arthrobacter woluwensis]PSS43154.1 hypothetical protein C6401_14010 [Arthrobacter woluwensis]
MRATLTAAETEILRGAPGTPTLLNLVDAASSAIAQLEPAHDILTYSKTHGPGPYSAGELEKAVPYERVVIEQTVDELASEGILNPRKPTR